MAQVDKKGTKAYGTSVGECTQVITAIPAICLCKGHHTI